MSLFCRNLQGILSQRSLQPLNRYTIYWQIFPFKKAQRNKDSQRLHAIRYADHVSTQTNATKIKEPHHFGPHRFLIFYGGRFVHIFSINFVTAVRVFGGEWFDYEYFIFSSLNLWIVYNPPYAHNISVYIVFVYMYLFIYFSFYISRMVFSFQAILVCVRRKLKYIECSHSVVRPIDVTGKFKKAIVGILILSLCRWHVTPQILSRRRNSNGWGSPRMLGQFIVFSNMYTWLLLLLLPYAYARAKRNLYEAPAPSLTLPLSFFIFSMSLQSLPRVFFLFRVVSWLFLCRETALRSKFSRRTFASMAAMVHTRTHKRIWYSLEMIRERNFSCTRTDNEDEKKFN